MGNMNTTAMAQKNFQHLNAKAMQEQRAIDVALDVFRQPLLAPRLQHQPLPKEMLSVIQIASGKKLAVGSGHSDEQLQQEIAPGASTATVKSAVIQATQTAGSQGVLIVSVGHGGAVQGSVNEGLFELGPNSSMTIAGGLVKGRFVDVFYDTRKVPGQPSDLENDLKNNPNSSALKNFRVYQEISAAIKSVGLLRVVLLTCNVGNATEFLRKVANDWGTVIQGYRKQVGIQQFVGTGSLAGTKPIRIVFLVGSAATPSSPASLIVTQEEEIPFDPAQTFLVGPPL